MKSLFAHIFTITIFMQPVTALAVDYSDFDSFCQTVRQLEVESIKKDVEEGFLTEAEAKEELEIYLPTVDQCVCYYQKVLEGTDADFTLHTQQRHEIEIMQELMGDENYRVEEILDVSTYPEGMDIVAFFSDVEKACGYPTE